MADDVRVLVVDDSVVVRRVVEQTLSTVEGIAVVGTAATGAIGVAKVERGGVDVVVLDVEMPDMDGVATLLAMLQVQPSLPVVVFSSHTGKGSPIAMEMLAKGARAYALKPANVSSQDEARDVIATELAPLILHAGGWTARRVQERRRTEPSPVAAVPRPTRPTTPARVIAIGSSTGGPEALTSLLEALPGTLPVPIVVTQHIPADFSRLLAERLASRCALKVKEALDGELLAAGTVYIAPGDHHLEIGRMVVRAGVVPSISLNQGPKENSCRPAVDPMLRSVASFFGKGTLALVLTGMGQDGMAGARAVRSLGGQVLVQDEATSVVWGMPGSVVRAGQADMVLPLPDIAGELVRRVSSRSSTYAARAQ